MVGDRERIHTQRLDPIEQIGDPIGAVEERVLAMRVEVNERHGYAAESAVFSAVMQWLMLVVTFVVMAFLQRLVRAAGGPLEAHATFALGCLTLAAFVAGTIAQRIRIPRIVGYLAAGYIAGPAWLHLIRTEELEVLSPISTGALALIAFAVGSELTLDALRGSRRQTVLRIAGAAMAVPFLAVAFVVLTVSPWFPLTAHQPFRDAMVVALALGTVAAVSSPTLVWAVMTDVDASGPMSRSTLDVSVVQDLAAVLLVIAILALALPLGSKGTVAPGVATHTLLILLGSIVVGITLGLALAQYLRVIHGRLAWVLVVAAFIVAQAVRLLGLDALLIALAAGSALRNAAPRESEAVRDELKRCAIPVYVVFFALAGSSLQFGWLEDYWPWALLLVGLRAVGLWGGLRWASRHPAVGADWARYGWLGFASQGALAMTLAALLGRAFPAWNKSLESLIVAMIGVHQLAGPICFQWVLRRTGEVTREGGAHVGDTPGTAEQTDSGVGVTGVTVLTGGGGGSV
jgi:Kef-type K+ transport system membrane component KefB